MEQLSLRDAWAERRRLGLRGHAFLILCATVVLIALYVLKDPALSEASRTFWTLLPGPFVGLVLWASMVEERRRDELQLSMSRGAESTAWRFTMVWLSGLWFLDAAAGPEGMPLGGEPAWGMIVAVPILFFLWRLATEHRRLFPRS